MSAPTRKETTPSFARVQHILSLCNVSSLPGILDLLDKGDTASAFDKDDAFPVAGPWKKKPSEGGQARGSSQQQRKAPQRQRKKYKRNQKKKKTKGHADEGAAISPTNTKLPNDSDVVMHDAPPSVENNAEEISADNASLSLHSTEPQQTQQPVEETTPTETGVMPEAGSEEKPTETLAGTPPAQSDNTLANTLHSNHNISSLNGLEKPQTVAQPEASPMQLEETTPEQEAAPMHPQPVSIPPATLPTYTPPPHSQPYPLQPYAIVIPQYYWHPSVVYPQGSWPYMFVQNPVYSKSSKRKYVVIVHPTKRDTAAKYVVTKELTFGALKQYLLDLWLLTPGRGHSPDQFHIATILPNKQEALLPNTLHVFDLIPWDKDEATFHMTVNRL